jgi:hypothetical protein
MNGLAALAAKEAALASGASLLPGIAPSAVDGFAVGTLLSGLCFLMVMAPKRGLRRRKVSASEGMLVGSEPVQPEYAMSVTLSDPFADEAAEVVVSADGQFLEEVGPEPKGAGYRSKHRQSDSMGGDRRPEIRRSQGRHAAPSNGIASRMAGRFAIHPLAVHD